MNDEKTEGQLSSQTNVTGHTDLYATKMDKKTKTKTKTKKKKAEINTVTKTWEVKILV